ncbi:MAG TPA: PIN domain-containing protein [Casimicrobiaceae bacterium]|nr:PIN domain-containing protein [Casimicrobiaceae bacterium]
MRVFLDTNVLVGAFASRGLCADLFEVVLLEHELITGNGVLRELRRALQQKIRLPKRHCDQIVEFVQGAAANRVQSSSPIRAPVDPDDAAILGEALSGESDLFVTGDAAVQQLALLGRMRILSPRSFWDLLHSGA